MTTSPEQTDLYIPTIGELVQEYSPHSKQWGNPYSAKLTPVAYRDEYSRGWRYRKAITEPAWSLPSPPSGQKWHRPDWTADMLPEGYRPLLDGEYSEVGDEFWLHEMWNTEKSRSRRVAVESWHFHRTRRPIPTENPLPEIPHGWRLVREDEKTAENAKVAKFHSPSLKRWIYNQIGANRCDMNWDHNFPAIIPIPDGEWIEWKPAFGNGECPVPGRVKVEVRQRKGVVTPSMAGSGVAGPAFWVNEDCSEDIIAYRVIPQEKPAAPAVSTSEPEPKGPHAEVKKAFDEGAKIEYRPSDSQKWRSCPCPTWGKTLQYRIAPNQDSPKPEKETQPTNTMASLNNTGMFPDKAQQSASTDPASLTAGSGGASIPDWNLPEVGSKWALQDRSALFVVLAASPTGIVCKTGNKGLDHDHYTPAQWNARKPVQVFSRRELKARAKNIQRLEAMIPSPSNYAAQSQPRKSMFRVILRPIWFRAKYVALGMTIGTVAGKAVVTKVVTAAPAVLNWITELLG